MLIILDIRLGLARALSRISELLQGKPKKVPLAITDNPNKRINTLNQNSEDNEIKIVSCRVKNIKVKTN